MYFHMSAGRVVRVLGVTAALAAVVLFGYIGIFSPDMHPFAEFALVKRIVLPVMYCLFAVALVWPMRGERVRLRTHVPLWWWLFFAASVTSFILSLIYRPYKVELLDFLQGVALFGGALVVAYAGLLAPRWGRTDQRDLFLFFGITSVLALVNLSTGLVPFIDIVIPTIGVALFLAARHLRYRLHLALFALVLCIGLVVVNWLGPAPATSIAVLAQIGTTLALLVLWIVPEVWRLRLVLGGLVVAVCGAAVSGVVPMFFGKSDYGDVTLAQRGYETAKVAEVVFSSPWTALFGLGPAGVVDLTASPDARTLEASGRVLSGVESVHLLTTHMLLKGGLLGLVAIIVLVWAMCRQVLIALSQSKVDTFDGVLLFYVIAGLAAALPAATNLFVNPLPLLFLGILVTRNRDAPSGVPLFHEARERVAGAYQRLKVRSRGTEYPLDYLGGWVSRARRSRFRVAVRDIVRGVRHKRLWGVVSTVVAVELVAAIVVMNTWSTAEEPPPSRAAEVTATSSPTPSPSADPVPSPSQTLNRPAVVAFIGDSYTRGAGVKDENLRWTTLVSRSNGWIEKNFGRGGTGYVLSAAVPADARRACGLDYCGSYTKMIGDAKAANPDIVVVSGGRNEVRRAPDGKWSTSIEATWALGVGAFFSELRAVLPRAQIVATSPIWDDEPAPEVMKAMRTLVQRAVTLNDGIYVDLRDPLLARPECLASDGIHPNQEGHLAIAQAFSAAYPDKFKALGAATR